MLRELNTAEDLDNLPFGAVIIDEAENVWKALRTGRRGQWLWISIYGHELNTEDLVALAQKNHKKNSKPLFSLFSATDNKISTTKAIGTMKTYSLEELRSFKEGTLFGAHETIPGDIIITTVWRCDGDGTASLISHESDSSELLSYFAVDPEHPGSGFYITVLQKPEVVVKRELPEVVVSSHGVAKRLLKELQEKNPDIDVTYGDIIHCVDEAQKVMKEKMVEGLHDEKSS